jgi:PAS domain S-box-containing protein
MSLDLTLFSDRLYIELPHGLVGWLGWFTLLAVTALFLRRWRGLQKSWKRKHWILFAVLALLIPLTSLFLVLRLPSGDALPPPGRPVDPGGPALVVFAALPWVLAAGLLGPAPAALFGALSGLALALWDTHSPFTPLEIALLALLLGAMLHQRYRTLFYRALRHPLAATILLSAFYPFLFLIDSLIAIDGSLANRLDYATTHVAFSSLAIIGQMLVAGLAAEVIASAAPATWGSSGTLLPSPAERRLETRFLYHMAPLAFAVLIALIVGDWIVAGNAARQMLRERMGSTAQTVSETVPFFLEAGQNLIQQLADDSRLYSEPAGPLTEVLAQDLRSMPFFNQLFLLDPEGKSITGYPQANYANSFPPPDELVGIELAGNGVPVQNYTIPPIEGEQTAQVSFIATVTDETDRVQAILVGRSDLESNPFTKPVLTGIRNMVGGDGEGMLLDSNGRVLYNTDAERLMQTYTGRTAEDTLFYDEAAPDGTRRLVYYQRIQGHPWSVILAVPARRAQQMALNIAAPLLVMVVLLFGFAVISLRLGLRVITSSMQNLSAEAGRIASGQLDRPLVVRGEDEVGQLRRAFEQMRLSLKSRLDELNQLLLVSQGVASSLEVEEAVKAVLESALSTGACSARIVLSPAVMPEAPGDAHAPFRIGSGPSNIQFGALDEQILDRTRQQDRVMLTNLARARLFNIPTGPSRPEALLALALRHENTYYGALWMAYDHPHPFSEDELRFLTTLAGQAALAAANARLFQSAEIGRQRLAAILDSTPDPVLVTDHQNRLLLANPAAWQILELNSEGYRAGEGLPIEKVTQHKELVKLLRTSSSDRQSAEILLPDGRVYLATASSVSADGQRMGRVCVLRDITHFKELDSLKSEFVSTVSHDLRSPLTLMRGYATMLEMVGQLNDQQTGYVRKIVAAVENMSRLVNNLLDLGRIEAGIDLQLEMILIHDVIERVVNSLQLQATQKRVSIVVDIPSQTVPLIEADQALLQQALYNLVENAIKYTESGGKVTVCVHAQENGLVFDVTDTGIGIAPVDQPRLFERFFRGAQRDNKKQHGSGLGLAIVKSITERHGGRVWMESQLGKGSSFYLLVPLRQPKHDGQALKGKQKT